MFKSGRENLIMMQNEVALRLNNHIKTYGQYVDKSSKRDFLRWNLRKDLDLISKALEFLDQRDGIRYNYSVVPRSRQDIAERLIMARKNSLINRYDEGVDPNISGAAIKELWGVQKEASYLDDIGYPLLFEELSDAEKRIKDRQLRMSIDSRVRKMNDWVLCKFCRSQVLADSIYCLNCGNLIGKKPEKNVFICYGSPDKKWAEDLASKLKKDNVEAWLDSWELLPGDSLVEGINKGIDRCDIFLFIASTESIGRFWPCQELEAAMIKRAKNKKDFKIIPILKDKCRHELPWLLKAAITVDFYVENNNPIYLDTDDGKIRINNLKNAILGIRSNLH